MAYARKGDDSDVYVYHSVGGYYCSGCWLTPGSPDTGWDTVTCPTAAEMLRHLDAHRAQHHLVPDRTFVRLRTDGGADG